MKPHLLPVALLLTSLANAQDPYKKSTAEPATSPAPETAPVLSIREETIAIPRKDAPEFLSSYWSDSDRLAELLHRVSAGKATLERLQLIRAKSGQRSLLEATSEFRWPVTEPAKDGGKQPSATETHNLGDTLEVEPVLGPDGRTIDLNLVTQSIRLMGYTEAPDATNPRQPIFRNRKINTSIALVAGEPVLIGSLNPPADSGIESTEKDEQLHLDFITVFVGSDGPSAPQAPSRTASLANSLVIAKVNLRDASIADAVQFLQGKCRDLDPEKKGLNFVVKAPPSAADARITIDLTNCPVSEVARYVAGLAGLKLTITDNALVFHAPGDTP